MLIRPFPPMRSVRSGARTPRVARASRAAIAGTAVGVVALLASPALGGVAWDESVSGDLSTNPAAPTPIAVAFGSNTVAGTMGSPADTRDVFTFTIAPGQALSAIFLLDYRDVSTGGLGNTGFIHIDDGASTVIPSPATILQFMGGSHLDRVQFPTVTSNVLTAMAGAPAGGDRFCRAAGAGCVHDQCAADRAAVDGVHAGPDRGAGAGERCADRAGCGDCAATQAIAARRRLGRVKGGVAECGAATARRRDVERRA